MTVATTDPDDIVAAENCEGYSTTKEIARHFRVEPNTVAYWARTGVIPFARFGRKVLRFRLGDVIAALEANRNLGNTEV